MQRTDKLLIQLADGPPCLATFGGYPDWLRGTVQTGCMLHGIWLVQEQLAAMHICLGVCQARKRSLKTIWQQTAMLRHCNVHAAAQHTSQDLVTAPMSTDCLLPLAPTNLAKLC